MIEFIANADIYNKVLLEYVPKTKKFLWIGTADIKDLYIHKNGTMKPFLELISDLIKKNVEVRLIHAKEPGQNFRTDFDKYPALFKGLERMLCPRVHFKCVIVDGKHAYFGSANLTGAGMGSKSDNKRNFENGIITDDETLINPLMQQFDNVWIGKHCKACLIKSQCSEFNDLIKK